MSARQRIVHALAANTMAQGITVLTQLLLTPLFFRQWGAATYGEWLLVSTIPAYLAMADLGIGTAAGNDMAMQAGAGRWHNARATYLAALRVSGLAALAVACVGALMGWVLAQGLGLHVQHIAPADAGWLALLLSLNVGLGFAGNVVSAGYRAAGANARGIMWGNAARLLDVLATAGLLLAGQPPLHVCALSVLTKAVLLLAQAQALRAVAPQLCQGPATAEVGLFKRLLRPSLAFMVLPLGNAMALQAPLMVLGAILGPQSVALFSAMRTLARIPMQLANALNASVWPEVSRVWGEGRLDLMRQLHRHSWRLTGLLGALSLGGQILLGGMACQLWLGPGHHDGTVLNTLAVVALLSALWNVSSVFLAAINAHTHYTLVYLIVNAACVAASIPACHAWGTPGLLACQVIAEAAMLMWMWPTVMKLTQDDATAFVRAVCGLARPHEQGVRT
jgi:O-antigen/teichoic acid export membrane protein